VSWPENTAFSPTLPTLQLAWDSVSSGTLKECPRLYQLSIIEGWQPRTKNIHLEFGILMHSARETYYHLRAAGRDHEDGVLAALDELDRPKAIFSSDSYKNRFTAARTIVWYLDQWENDPLETIILANSKPAVEVSFQYPLGIEATTGEQFLHCGHIDRLVRFQDKLWGSDLKTSKNDLNSYFFAQFTPDNQLSGYSFAGKIILDEPTAGIIVDGAQVAVGFSRFARGLVLRSQAEQYARDNFWPMNEKACYGCSFRGICSHSPQVREKWLAADFVKRIWNPLEARGRHLMPRSELIDLAMKQVGETEKAWRLTDGVKTGWVPKSQVEQNGDGTWTMPEWLAQEKEFI
jgi:hypothetical protein